MNFITAGARRAVAQRQHIEASQHDMRLRDAAEKSRAQWLHALEIDRLRAWMSLGEADTGVILGMASMLTLACHVHAYAAKANDTPTMRILRGAISAAAQCAEGDKVVRVEHAQAWGVAVERALDVIRDADDAAIIAAAVRMAETAKGMTC